MPQREKKSIKLLCFESSCDDTSVAVVEGEIRDEIPSLVSLSIQNQNDLHSKYGGIVPELASRAHLENLIPCLKKVLHESRYKLEDFDAFAATGLPGLTGSLLIGHTAAKLLSMLYSKPFLSCHHLQGHLMSIFLEHRPSFPFLALVVSGGHTSLFLVRSFDDFEEIGVTLDDAAGEAFDKGAKLLGLGFPGGAYLEKLALGGDVNRYPFPQVTTEDLNFSFSGIKSEMVRCVNREKEKLNRSDAAAGYQNCIIDHIVEKIKIALKKYHLNRVAVVGGVACNQLLKQRIKDLQTKGVIESFFAPKPEFCTDNAAMIGVLAFRKYQNQNFSSLDSDVGYTKRPKLKRLQRG